MSLRHHVAAIIALRPAPLYIVRGATDNHPPAYVPDPIRQLPLHAVAAVSIPAWAILTSDQIDQLLSAHADLAIYLIMRDFNGSVLVRPGKR